MNELWLVCEGEPDSVDVVLLERIFTDVLAAGFTVTPGFGSNPSILVPYLESQGGGRAAFVNDRDYHPRSRAEDSLGDGKPGFYWRRHSIENYLLPPAVLRRAFGNHRERFQQQHPGSLPERISRLPVELDELTQTLRECALNRAAEEACRMATYRLWTEIPGEAKRVEPRNPKASGMEPSVWREALCQEAERVRAAAATTAGCRELGREAVTQIFDRVYAEITAETYLEESEFLIDFHGRDLLKAFRDWLDSRGVRLSHDRLCQELIPAAVREYGNDRTLYHTDDFRDLANGVRSLAGLAPLA